MSNKKAYETAAHANDGYVTKDAPLILFRGALDHCQAEIIVTQAMLDQEILFARSIDPAIEASLKCLQNDLQELVDVLRDIMTAEYTGEPLKGIHSDGSGGTFRLFGLTLDELQEHSHNAEEHYGIPTMTRPDHRYGEVYAHLNLIRTELRQVESAAVRLFLQNAAVSSGDDFEAEAPVVPDRQDILYVLNRLSSAAHVLMCRHLSELRPDIAGASYTV
ncbi:MAG: hypothetical protein IIZ76_01355 [Clostridia bacterium]|nr:hypothetical protein [Clostridia bacterium]